MALVIIVIAIATLRTKKQPSIVEAKNYLPIESYISAEALVEKNKQQESEKEALRHEPWKHKRNPSETVAYTLLLLGTIALVISILYSSSILAFIGLGLTLWGALLLFIKPTKYVKASLLDSTVISSLRTVDQMIKDLDYEGKAIYLPPRYFKQLKGGKVFVPSKENSSIPPAEEIAEEEIFLKNPKGICLTPPGLGLANLYEKELRKDFAKVDLNYLQNNLPKLFIEDLEIAENFELTTEDNVIQAKITGSIYKSLCEEARKLSRIGQSIGCPLCSSIAIALTRATGSAVIIEKIEESKDGKTIEANFRLLEAIEPQAQAELLLEEMDRLVSMRVHAALSNFASLLLTGFGSIILAWVGWLTWYDITMWDKDIALIFFGSRTGEAISLGIGMKVIYYFLIGLALILSGLPTFLRRKRSKV